MERIQNFLNSIHWYGHDSFMIKWERIIYIDPWNLPKNLEKADLILVTHPHYDHFSVEDIEKIKKQGTILVGPKDVISQYKGEKKEIAPDTEIEVMNVKIKGIPAYNINKKFHPKANNWVGYIITLDNITLYHTGDTDFIPEMKKIEKIDIAFFPVGGTYTMDALEAAEACNAISPKIAIPMHWGSIIGNYDDVETFKKHCKSEIKVLKKEE
ncbi:MAG: MBL fold metallo-hydrolase [Acidobacteriota bacterium]